MSFIDDSEIIVSNEVSTIEYDIAVKKYNRQHENITHKKQNNHSKEWKKEKEIYKNVLVKLDIICFENDCNIHLSAIEFDFENGVKNNKFNCIINTKSVCFGRCNSIKYDDITILNLVLFSEFLSGIDKKNNIHIWTNEMRFELGIIQSMYNSCDLSCPWNPKNERDIETIITLYPEIKEKTPFHGNKYNPINVCEHQIEYFVKTYNKIKNSLN